MQITKVHTETFMPICMMKTLLRYDSSISKYTIKFFDGDICLNSPEFLEMIHFQLNGGDEHQVKYNPDTNLYMMDVQDNSVEKDNCDKIVLTYKVKSGQEFKTPMLKVQVEEYHD